jgi:hypothetical protein
MGLPGGRRPNRLEPDTACRAICARAAEDVMMRSKTTALALAGALIAVPAAADAEDPPTPGDAALRAPLGGHATVAGQMRAERYANLRDDLTARAAQLARRLGRSAGAERARLRRKGPDEIRRRIRSLERQLAPPISPTLEAIAACESGGNPATDTGNGFYGKYQFDLATWQSLGGTGNPSRASEAEQDRRAATLYARSGASPWRVCGR